MTRIDLADIIREACRLIEKADAVIDIVWDNHENDGSDPRTTEGRNIIIHSFKRNRVFINIAVDYINELRKLLNDLDGDIDKVIGIETIKDPHAE